MTENPEDIAKFGADAATQEAEAGVDSEVMDESSLNEEEAAMIEMLRKDAEEQKKSEAAAAEEATADAFSGATAHAPAARREIGEDPT